MLGANARHEIRQSLRPFPPIFDIENTLSKTSEKSRCAVLYYLTSRTNNSGARKDGVSQGYHVVFVPAGTVQQEQMMGHRCRGWPVNVLKLCVHTNQVSSVAVLV